MAIIGAGMSGLCMAMKLQDAGIDSFVIYEQADDVGGTWRDNTYPGLHCDVPSPYYSYSFLPNPEWSRMMPPGREIQQYLRRVADERDIRRFIRFGTEVTFAEYTGGRWQVATDQGVDEFDVLITATGFLRVPRYPDIRGSGHLRRTVVPLGPLGSLGHVAGQAHRADRDRIHRRADHRRARRKGQAAQGVPAHRPVDRAVAQHALPGTPRAGPQVPGPGPPGLRVLVLVRDVGVR